MLEKPELNRVLSQRKEKQRLQELDEQINASKKRTSLEMKLEKQAQKVDEVITSFVDIYLKL